MSTLELVVDVVVRGAVLGADRTSSPEDVERILGATPAVNRSERQMWRDHGLVEFFWEQGRSRTTWRGTHFTVQLHRLRTVGPEEAAAPILERYGPLQASLRFTDLQAALADLGVDLVELPSVNEEHQEYWQPDSAVHLLVTDGEVEHVISPLRAEAVASRFQGLAVDRQRVGHLLQASEQQRLAWIGRRQPGPQDAANWWLRLLLQIEHETRGQADRRLDAARLYVWAVHQARGVFSPDETAVRIAFFVLSLRSRGDSSEFTGVLPSADDVVRDCLDALPITLDQARTPCVLSAENFPAMRASRRAKNLVTAAAHHLPDLHDQALAERLRAWIAVKPGLV